MTLLATTPSPPPVGAPVGPQVPPELFKRFVDFVYAISGIRFADSKAYFLNSKLDGRRQALQLPTLQAYYDYLQKPEAKLLEIPALLNEVTINETFFYRNQQQLQCFWDQLLIPMLGRKRQAGQRNLRFLSAACSTGDEPYTFALDLANTGVARDLQVDIIGMDISQRALDVAKQGLFKKYAVRNIPPPLLQRYFTEKSNGGIADYQLNDDIKRMVRFGHGSLMDGQALRLLGKMDVIFCRNVLIYFDRASREQVLKNLADALSDDGYLLVGHSENLYAEKHIFRPVKEFPNALAYQKTSALPKVTL